MRRLTARWQLVMHPNHRLTVKSTLHRLEKSFMLSWFFFVFLKTHFHHLCLSLPHSRGEKPTDSLLYHVEINQSGLLGLEGDYLRVRLHNHPQICTVVTYVYRKAIFVLCQVWASFNYKWKANNVLRQELILLCPTLSQRFFFPKKKKKHWKPYCCLDWLPFIILKHTWMMTIFHAVTS